MINVCSKEGVTSSGRNGLLFLISLFSPDFRAC